MFTTIIKHTTQISVKKVLSRGVVSIGIILLSVNNTFAQTCNNAISPSTPTARFTPQGDGTVLDTQTNLIWQRCLAGQTWNNANSSCDGTPGNYTWQQALNLPQGNWRVPNIKELSSIVEISCYDPAINLTVFPNATSSVVWSSSPYAGSSNYAWNIYFYDGYDDANFKNDYVQVRLVRSGQ